MKDEIGALKVGDRVEAWHPSSRSWVKVEVTRIGGKTFQGTDKEFVKVTGMTKWRLPSLTSVPVSVPDSPSLESASDLSLLDSVTTTKLAEKSSPTVTLDAPSSEMSNDTTGETSNMTEWQTPTLSPPPLPANPSQSKENDLGQMMSEIVSRLSSEQSTESSQTSSVSKTSPDSSLAPINPETSPEHILAGCSKSFTPAGTMRNGFVSPAPTLEAPGVEKESLLLESPGALSTSGKGRPPGSTRLEDQLRGMKAIASNEVANPEFLEAGFNLPAGWTNPREGRSAWELQAEMEQLESAALRSETPSTPELPPLDSSAFSTSTVSEDDEEDELANLFTEEELKEWVEEQRIFEEENNRDTEEIEKLIDDSQNYQYPIITIDPEFKALIPPLSPEERSQLEANLKEYGCRDPLVLWRGHNTLLDGHNRHEICTRLEIPFKVVEISLATRADAYNWLIDNQLGRRNLTPEAIAYLRGKRYQQEKTVGHGAKNSAGHNDTQNDTAERLAEEYKVSATTIKRDAKFASAVDEVSEVAGEEARQEILSRGSRLTKKDTVAIARAAKTEGELAAKQLLQEKTGQWVPKWGDRVDVIGGYFEGHKGQITGTPAPGFAVVALDGNGHERIALEHLRLDGVAVQELVTGPSKPTFDAHGTPETRSDEQCTPRYIWQMALDCSGVEKFDLDPCSNSKDAPNVPAQRVYTIEDDGLNQNWAASTLWLNPPYSDTKLWVEKIIEAHSAGAVVEGYALVKGDFSTQWFQPLLEYPVCLVDHRVAFINPKNEGRSAKFTSAIVYFGENVERFYSTFDSRYSDNGIGIVVQAVVRGVHFGE